MFELEGRRFFKFALLLFACSVFCVAEAQALPSTVRVRLFSSVGSGDVFKVTAPFRIISPHAQVINSSGSWYVEKSGAQVRISPPKCKGGAGITGSAVVIAPLARSLIIGCGKSARRVQGTVTFALKDGVVSPVLKLPAKDYVYGVVGSESLPEFSEEALKAQAVLVDTWLSHRKADEIIGDDTSDMAYLGADYARPSVLRAVDKTFPEVLVDKINGHVIKAFFHSTCGGKLSLSTEIFSGKRESNAKADPFICKYCQSSPFYKATNSKLSVKDVRDKLAFDIVEIVQRDDAGRPLVVSIDKSGAKKEVSGYQLWLKLGQNFGWGTVPGMDFDIKREGLSYTLTSRGAGHGIGLCQWGAQGMSLAPFKKDYRQILGYYFPRARISNSSNQKVSK